MRQPHSANVFASMYDAAEPDDEQREEEAERRRGLDPARGVAALVRSARARPRRSPRRRTRRRAPGPGSRRSVTSRIGASQPIGCVGRQQADQRRSTTPITTMVTRKVYLRPTRSPMRPKTSAPNGRTRKPAA